MYLRDSFPKSLAPRVLLTLLLWGNHQRDGSPAWHFNKIWTICIFFKRLFFNYPEQRLFLFSLPPFLLGRTLASETDDKMTPIINKRASIIQAFLWLSNHWVDIFNKLSWQMQLRQCEARIRTLYSNSEHLYITGQIRHKNNWSSNYSWIRLLFRGLQWVILGHGVRGMIPGCKCYLKRTP